MQRTSTERRGVILLSLSYDDDYNVLNGEIIRLGNLPKMDSFSGTSGNQNNLFLA